MALLNFANLKTCNSSFYVQFLAGFKASTFSSSSRALKLQMRKHNDISLLRNDVAWRKHEVVKFTCKENECLTAQQRECKEFTRFPGDEPKLKFTALFSLFVSWQHLAVWESISACLENYCLWSHDKKYFRGCFFFHLHQSKIVSNFNSNTLEGSSDDS